MSHDRIANVVENMLPTARQIVNRAEAALGALSNGQRRDLLKDNLELSADVVAELVNRMQQAFGIFYVSEGEWVQHGSNYVNRGDAAAEAAIFNALTGRGAVVMMRVK